MPKGKPWTEEQEKQLKELLESGKPIEVIAKTSGKTQKSVSDRR